MARVVQRRTSQTTMYLMIVFVFLFLVAAGLAVVWHMENEELTKKMVQKDELHKKFISGREKNSPEVKKFQADYEKAKPGEKKTVYGVLVSQISGLTHKITGLEKSDAATAITASEDAAKFIGKRGNDVGRGLATELKEAWKKATREEEQKLKSQNELYRTKIIIEKYLADLNDIKGDFVKDKESLMEDLAKLQDDIASEKTEHIGDVRGAEERAQATAGDLNKRIAVLTAGVEKLRLDNARLKAENAELTRRIIKYTTPDVGGVKVARKVDGRILKISNNKEICYISLGKRDNVRPGLPFSVYPPSGVSEDGQGKAKLVVTKVMEDISECKVAESSQGDAINVGDPIANIAFDPQRTYVFVVQGSFDLYDTGRATSLGANEVKALIRRSGGKIADKVTVETDFVVMGEIPSKPRTPTETAEPSAWEVYREQLKIYERYTQMLEQAQGLSKPILNSNSFLSFMGYIPVKTRTR